MNINAPADAPAWATEALRDVASAIAAPAQSSIRLKGLATADLPDPTAPEHIYGIIFDLTTGAPKYSNGTAWVGLPSANEESGLWTPTLRFGGGTTGMTATTGGRYTKIGHMVHLNGWVTLTAKGSSTGNATIAGLPFSSANRAGSGVTGAVTAADGTMAALTGSPKAFIGSNTAIIGLVQANATGEPSMTHNQFTNTSAIWFSITYFV